MKEIDEGETESKEEIAEKELEKDEELKVQKPELSEDKSIHSPNTILINMTTINKYINDVELERELDKVLNEEYSLFEECGACYGFRILHREGACLRKTPEEMDVIENERQKLVFELALKMEEYRKKTKRIEERNKDGVKEIIDTMLSTNERLVGAMTERGRTENILTKPKNPPAWGPVDYERYEEQVNYWNQDSKDSEISKFNLLLNELNKKKEIPGSVMKVIHDRTHSEGRTVENILEVLREKFAKTFAERTKEMIERMATLMNMKEDESGEQIWDNFYSLVVEFEKLELNKHPRYMLAMMMISGMERKKKLTEEEKQRFEGIMETDDRKPRPEDRVMESLKKEFMKAKVEGKRMEVKENASTETFYI